MKTVYKNILESLQQGKPIVIVTLIEHNGSTPRTAGAKMLVRDDASIIGTVGGGLYEAKAIELAQELFLTHSTSADASTDNPDTPRPDASNNKPDQALVVSFDLRGNNAPTDMDMICGGTLRLLVNYIPVTSMAIALYETIVDAENAGPAWCIITRIEVQTREDVRYAVKPETSLYILPTTDTPSLLANLPKLANVPGEVLQFVESIDTHTAHSILHGVYEYILEVLHAPYVLHIFGAGHVSCELAKIADYLEFATIAIDDRAEFANAKRFPTAKPMVLDSLDSPQIVEYFKTQCIGSHTGIVIVTRGHARDRDVLAAALETQAGYIGMIGSKSKRQATCDHLAQSGYDAARFSRIHSPIGLSIGAQTPEEIAISISAELIKWRAGVL